MSKQSEKKAKQQPLQKTQAQKEKNTCLQLAQECEEVEIRWARMGLNEPVEQ